MVTRWEVVTLTRAAAGTAGAPRGRPPCSRTPPGPLPCRPPAATRPHGTPTKARLTLLSWNLGSEQRFRSFQRDVLAVALCQQVVANAAHVVAEVVVRALRRPEQVNADER